jgi:hypothetical protein
MTRPRARWPREAQVVQCECKRVFELVGWHEELPQIREVDGVLELSSLSLCPLTPLTPTARAMLAIARANGKAGRRK